MVLRVTPPQHGSVEPRTSRYEVGNAEIDHLVGNYHIPPSTPFHDLLRYVEKRF